MKIANIGGRAHLITATGGFDIRQPSGNHFPADPQALITVLPDLKSWLEENSPQLDSNFSIESLGKNLTQLDAPIPNPQQVFAIGLNYLAHGDEVDMQIPAQPMIFTKFPSSIGGPAAEIKLPNDTVDWEIEMVVVIGKSGRYISKSQAMEYIAGYCVGQDISERSLQMANTPPQFSVAKSYENFAPIGPWLTSADEVDISNLNLKCQGGGEVLQDGNTKDMIFDVPTLIEYISGICELRTGDIIFSGTPDGVGMGRNPQKFMEAGWLLESEIQGLGKMANPVTE